jgi:lipid A 4'-phosphatase
MNRWPYIEATGFVFTMVLAGVVFLTFPGIDPWVSSFFWSPHAGWFLKDWLPFHAVYLLVPDLTWLLAVGLLTLLALILATKRRFGPFDQVRVTYLLLSLAIGPGLIANVILKDHWGRARPSQVTLFGGSAHFTPALIPADQCDHNCSFVSGHGSMAFALIAFAFLVQEPRRRRWAIRSALAFGVLVGFVRIAQGAHFLSDTVFAAFFMIGSAWLLHRWIIEADGLSAAWVGACTRVAGRLGGIGIRHLQAVLQDARGRWVLVHLGTAALILLSIVWFDRPVARFFHVPDDRLTHWLRWITNFGEGWGWLVLFGLAALACRILADASRSIAGAERWKAWALVPLYLFLCAAVSGLATDILKILIARTRPKLLFNDGLFTWGGPSFHASRWSFPSGHVTTVASIAAGLSVLWPRHIVAYWLLVALVALSRLGVGAHYPSDTIGGAWIGIMTALYLKGVFARAGAPLEDAQAGLIAAAPTSWRYRLLGRLAPGRGSL